MEKSCQVNYDTMLRHQQWKDVSTDNSVHAVGKSISEVKKKINHRIDGYDK